MASGKTIIQNLQNYCSKQKENNPQNYQFSHKTDHFSFGVNVKDFDKFSFVIEALQVEQPNGVEANVLKKQAEFLKANLTYLLENIEAFEIDEINLKAQLRSNTPYKEESSLSYYEIIIDGGRKISLKRLVFNKQDKQGQFIPFYMTNEVLERTIDDFMTALQISQL